MASRQKLPNLKICVDNTESSSESDVEVQESDSSDSDDEDTLAVGPIHGAGGLEEGEVHEDDVLSIAVDRPTERRFLSRSSLRSGQRLHTYGPKIYENKLGNFVTGVDVTSEEAREKQEKRAERFGTLSTPKQPITDVDIKNLYKSLGMNIQTLDQDPRGWRMEAILIRGTENMSTKDVFDYFSEYGPKGVEWIDDFSCNVIWLDKLTPARALIKLSSSFDEVQLAEKIVDEDMDDSQANKPNVKESNQEKTTSDVVVKTEKDSTVNSAMETAQVPSKEPDVVSGQERADLQKEPVLNVLEEETMELDFDDNLDLTAEDPIDQALSTWSNFTQNKKERAERAETADKKKMEKREKDANESLSEKEKRAGKISEKEVDDSGEKEEGNKRKENSGMAAQQRGSGNNSQNIDNRVIEENSNKTKDLSKQKKMPSSKEEKKGQMKDTDSEKSKSYKKKEKMETEDGSDSDSGSSSSSSSSGSSSSGSSSGSDSDSGSNSSGSSSSSSSSSSGNSSEGSKKKRKKTKEERDKEKQVRKTTKKPEAPPIPPLSREKSDIPWPPGWWRLGVPCAKADYLFLRYAMKADKKLPGAEKKSKYYVKHGNPNFGGIKGLISNSRKRRLRNIGRDDDIFESATGIEDARPALGPISTVQSRLGGRLGTSGGKWRSRDLDRDEGEVEEVENERPKLKEGKDLRDLLNRDASALKYDSDEGAVGGRDSEDEMDYGAELERLMGDEEPPSKKRFMRMHADDEEEKMHAQRITRVNRDTRKWPRRDFDQEDRLDLEEEEEEGELEDTETLYPRQKEWVDYDNVEDHDPFNLFGTSKRETAPSNRISDIDDEEEMDHRQRYGRDDSQGGRRDRNLKNRLGSLHDRPGDERAGATVGGGIDLRAKLQGRRRAGNRNW